MAKLGRISSERKRFTKPTAALLPCQGKGSQCASLPGEGDSVCFPAGEGGGGDSVHVLPY